MDTKSKIIPLSAILKFPDPIIFIKRPSGILAISPVTANWIILKDESSLELMKLLISGKTIAETLSHSDSLVLKNKGKAIIERIMSREFAGLQTSPKMVAGTSITKGFFYLTNACNLSCEHCYMLAGKTLHNELSAHEFCLILEDFKSCGGVSATFSGGEPYLKKGFFDILAKANELGLEITVLTNGTLWSIHDIDKSIHFLNEVQISIDGPDSETYKMTRKKDLFLKVLSTAMGFVTRGVRTSIAMTPTLGTIDIFEQNFSLFNESINKFTENGGIVRISHKLIPGRFGRMSIDDEKRYRNMAIRLTESIDKSSNIKHFSQDHLPNIGRRNCGFGSLTVNSDGSVYPCNRVSELQKIGNVRLEKLEQIIKKLSEIECASSVDKAFPCHKCHLKYVCGGGCRIDNFSYETCDVSVNNINNFENGLYLRKDCSEDWRTSLHDKMIDSFRFQYGFNDD